MSLKELVDKHGFKIIVASEDSSLHSFEVLREFGNDKYLVRDCITGKRYPVLQECEKTNDYYFVVKN